MKTCRLSEQLHAQFNDAGINELFERIMLTVEEKTEVDFMVRLKHHAHIKDTTSKSFIIPPNVYVIYLRLQKQ